jgi:hypothetical protein
MTVEISNDRVAYVLTYDDDVVKGSKADLRCTNPSNMEDVSTREGFDNDGNVVVSFPLDYTGETEVTITGSEGGEDTGTIQV